MRITNDNKPPFRILLVDDHRLVRQELRALLERQSDLSVVGEFSSAESAYRSIGRLLPDLVIMDISMSGWNGIQATGLIKKEWPQVTVLAFSMSQEPDYLRQMLLAGASGYVLKSSPASVLLEAVRCTLHGETYIDSALAASSVSVPCRPESPLSVPEAALSEKEREILIQVARGQTNQEIAMYLNTPLQAVETDRASAMDKLELHTRIDLIRYALKQNWITEAI